MPAKKQSQILKKRQTKTRKKGTTAKNDKKLKDSKKTLNKRRQNL
jgi:hypothetical protein